MGIARRHDGGEAGKAANAVIGMDHEVANREARRFGQHVAAALGPRAAHQAIAQNVLLADHGESWRLEPGIQRKHGDARHVGRKRNRLSKCLDTSSLTNSMLAEKRGQSLPRADAPTGNQGTFAAAPELADMGNHGVEYIAGLARTLDGKVTSLPATKGDDGRALGLVGMLERIEGDRGRLSKRLLPFLLIEEHRLRLDRMIGRRAKGLALKRLQPRIVMVGDLFQTSGLGVVGQRIEGENRAGEIIEQSFEPLMEQRQPVLHALVLTAGGDRLVERVVAGDRTEQLDIARAKSALYFGVQRDLAHGEQRQGVEPPMGALGLRIEGADRLERIAEEIETHRLGPRCEQIENTTAHGVLTGIGHRA